MLDFFAINRLTKTLYDLGKGKWQLLMQNEHVLNDAWELEFFILDNVFESKAGYQPVAERVAAELVDFIGSTPLNDISIVSDQSDDIFVAKCLGYACVGSRYLSISYDDLNFHLGKWSKSDLFKSLVPVLIGGNTYNVNPDRFVSEFGLENRYSRLIDFYGT